MYSHILAFVHKERSTVSVGKSLTALNFKIMIMERGSIDKSQFGSQMIEHMDSFPKMYPMYHNIAQGGR